MRIDLIVPYDDKEKAKILGARWDGIRKCWYIVDKEDLLPFMAWMPKHLAQPHAKGKKVTGNKKAGHSRKRK
ncbi:MAG: DUF5710 domain-containing protein [Methylobacter sp.]|uniref:DUF5710 domain-containing protein n=1 Tax=Methylobacter sp. TaxID=2051955 RepID=UPI0025E5ED7D|nr:DUF5710 domain-containing protein [Methylobacter sp.]MCK9622178.1 DUF5710 domain-containing protein [Methylobacter sp.]